MKEGLYEQIINKEIQQQLNNLEQEKFIIDKDKIDKEEAKAILSQYISQIIRKSLNYIRDKEKEDSEKLIKQIEACNDIINILSKVSNEEDIKKYEIDKNGEMLTALYSKVNNKRALNSKKATRPVTPLSQSSLFTGSGQEPNMLGELNKEILSCDSIDLLVSFVKWSGIRCIIESLREATINDNKKLRIITTSYMGATDVKAIEELSKLPNTEIKISYDTDRTRLHAKAYMFKRETGFTTAYIGSSNLSNAALTSGLEWNLKITEQDSFDIIKKFEATFESYWNDSEFVSYNGTEEDKRRLQISLRKEQKDSDNDLNFTFDIRPYAYQKEILEKLQVERKIFNKNRNLDIYLDGSNCEPFAEQIEVIFKNESEQYNFLPDVFVMCDDAKTLGESFISTPKIVFEVVSEEYSDNDYFIKARIYQKFGVLEYNIVEPSGSITQYRLINGHYGTPKVFEGNDVYTSVVFNDLKINLKDIFI